MLRVPHRLHRGLPDRRARDRVEARLHLHPRRVPRPSTRSCVAALEEARDGRTCSATSTIVVHRGAGAYICGEETALLESLEGKRGQPRSKPPFPAIAGPLRLADADQQRRDDRDGAADHRAWAARSTRSSASRTRRARASSRSPATSRGRATTSSSSGTPLRELIYDIGGGDPRRPRAEGGHPGRLVRAGPHAPTRSTSPLDFDSLAEAGTLLGSAAVIVIDDRCCMVQLGAPRRAVLHARVVRQVHAVPRGDALDGADPRARSRTGDAAQGELDLLLDVCDRILGKCLCPLGDAAAMPVASYVDKFRDEFQRAHRRGRLPVRRRVVARRRRSRRSTSTRHARVATSSRRQVPA